MSDPRGGAPRAAPRPPLALSLTPCAKNPTTRRGPADSRARSPRSQATRLLYVLRCTPPGRQARPAEERDGAPLPLAVGGSASSQPRPQLRGPARAMRRPPLPQPRQARRVEQVGQHLRRRHRVRQRGRGWGGAPVGTLVAGSATRAWQAPIHRVERGMRVRRRAPAGERGRYTSCAPSLSAASAHESRGRASVARSHCRPGNGGKAWPAGGLARARRRAGHRAAQEG